MDPQQASSARAAATSLSLLEQVRGQDSAAWGKLVFLYAPLIQHWCRQGGAREGVDDVAQEVLIAIAGGLESFQRQRTGSFRTWVKGITRYKLLDHFRRQGNQPNATGGSDAYQAMLHSPAIDDTDDPSEASDLYRRALSLVQERFEARTWQAFWQTAVDGEPTDVVANRLGMTAGAVRIARSRVLATLREEVGDLIA